MLNKAIEHGKEHRKPYYGSKAIDCTCRNHGGCSWCLENRMIKTLKQEESMEQKEKEYEENESGD